MKRPRPTLALNMLARVIDALRRDPDKPAPKVQLGTHDHDWLASLLMAIARGEDVRGWFYVTRKGAPSRYSHVVFVALDVALHRIRLGKVLPARKEVAIAWKIPEHTVKRYEQWARSTVVSVLKDNETAWIEERVTQCREEYLGALKAADAAPLIS